MTGFLRVNDIQKKIKPTTVMVVGRPKKEESFLKQSRCGSLMSLDLLAGRQRPSHLELDLWRVYCLFCFFLVFSTAPSCSCFLVF